MTLPSQTVEFLRAIAAGNVISQPTSAKFKDGSIKNNGDLSAFKAEIMEKLNA